jgi:uncharacterized protein
MKGIIERLEEKNWEKVTTDMNVQGYAVVPSVLNNIECDELVSMYNAETYRKTINMERFRFGLGEYKYFQYPLPELLENIRQTVYPRLSPIANGWMEALKIDKKFPSTFNALQKLCHQHNQTKPTILILKYGSGGYNTLHQDLYGEIYFPMQLVLFLNQPDADYTGGEFVMMEQVPRAQSKAIVLKPQKGDMLLFTTNFRPVKGSKGFYRVNMKHGVSQLHSGRRHTLGIIFHDALS